MPAYVSVARGYYKVGELAETHWKYIGGARGSENMGEPTMVGTRKGWKYMEGTRNVQKYLVTTVGR